MKKITSYFLFIALFSGLSSTTSFSQGKAEKENYAVVTGGAGFSLVGLLFSAFQSASNSIPGSEFSLTHTPVLAGNFDYVFNGKFSLGAAYTYQSFNGSYTNYQYTSNGVEVYGTWKDKVIRSNYALRPIFHFGKGEDLDPYLGCRLGFTQWAFRSSNPDPYYSTGDFYGSRFSPGVKFQGFFGVRYYFTDFLGFNAELAVGPTYYSLFGLSAKF